MLPNTILFLFYIIVTPVGMILCYVVHSVSETLVEDTCTRTQLIGISDHDFESELAV